MSLKIYLIRHGEKTLDGKHLSQKGIKQANLLAKRFANIHFKKIYSSPLERCKQTTEIINKKHSLKVFYEKSLEEVKGTVKEFPEKHPQEIATIKTFYEKIVREKGEILVSSSGIVNRILLGMFLDIPVNKAHFIQNPTGVNIIDKNPVSNTFRILCVNETSHLPENLNVRQED